MPRFSEAQIDEVRSHSDIVRVIGNYVRLKRTGSDYTGLCPFHSEKTPSFHVNPARQMYKCFGCGVAGNVLTFVMEYENLTFPEAMEQLAGEAGIELPRQEMTTQQRQQESMRQTLLEINKKAARYYFALLKSPAGKQGYEYLTGRGLTEETILHFGLGFAGRGGGELYRYMRREGYSDELLKESGLFHMDERGAYDKFWNRVMFPIMDVQNRVIGFGGRVMGDAKPKYLNSPETGIFEKSRNLFGLNYARRGKHDQMILCEGYMDVIAMHQAGFTNAVASLGTAFTEQQALLLRRYADEILLTYDSDEAGVKAAMRAIPILRRAGLVGKVIHMEPYKDPDEFIKNLGAEEFQTRIREAQNSFFFEIDVMRRQYSMNDPEQKTRFVHEIARKLLVFEDKIQRDNYLEAVASEYHIRSEDLRQLVVRYGNRMPTGYQEVMEQRQQERLRKSRQREPRDGIGYSYQLLLSLLVQEPSLFPQIRQWIEPDDFAKEPYRTVAQKLYAQLEKGAPDPAGIVTCFMETEQQKEVAAMLQTGFDNAMNAEEKKKAVTDLVIRIREHSIEEQAGNITDLKALQELVAQKKMLQNAVKLHIS